jgi:hypothetical protein
MWDNTDIGCGAQHQSKYPNLFWARSNGSKRIWLYLHNFEDLSREAWPSKKLIVIDEYRYLITFRYKELLKCKVFNLGGYTCQFRIH